MTKAKPSIAPWKRMQLRGSTIARKCWIISRSFNEMPKTMIKIDIHRYPWVSCPLVNDSLSLSLYGIIQYVHIKNITHVSSLLNHCIRDVRDPKQTMRFSSLSKQENHVLVPMCPTACISCIPKKPPVQATPFQLAIIPKRVPSRVKN